MYVQQLYTNCLAHAAYYIESGKEAAVIDPLRNPEPYLQLAAERGARIKYIFETHFHADFVSGHLDLANQSGATIVFGPGAQPEYKAFIAADGEKLHLGNAIVEVLHTPGHTLESSCYWFKDGQNAEGAVFTGDTLFVNEVGRPDLMSGNLPKEVLAGMLFDSLQHKIKTLPDNTMVYPGHGAGSACGKNIGKESWSTIVQQRANNYALRIANKEEFIAAVTTGLPIAPAYFFTDAVLNKKDIQSYREVVAQSLKPLALMAFQQQLKEPGTVVLDTRSAADFAAGYVTGALNVGLNGDFAVWVGHFFTAHDRVLLVADEGRETEAIERLARIGFDNVVGYLDGGMRPWFAANLPYERIVTVSCGQMQELINAQQYEILDVRNRTEVAKNRVPGSIHIALSELKEQFNHLDSRKKWLVYCAGGYRSMVASSFLKAHGYHFIANLEGGINAILKQQPEMVEVGLETE